MHLAVEKGRSANTLAAYRRDLEAFEDFLHGRAASGPEDATTSFVGDYVAFMAASGHKPTSINRAMATISGLFRFLVTEGSLSSDPTAEVERPGVPVGLPKALSEEEIARLLEGVVGDGPLVLRDRAILELLYAGGLRISELVGLSLGDAVALETGAPGAPAALLKVFGKGAKERLVPVGRLARVAVADWLSPRGRPQLEPQRWARRGDAEALFLNARGGRLSRQGTWLVVRKWGSKAGLAAKLSPHVIRHSCATHMLDHGADIRVVQELLGHASIATTQIYTKVSTARLRAVYDQAHPRAQRA